jgi:hypothetical protein
MLKKYEEEIKNVIYILPMIIIIAVIPIIVYVRAIPLEDDITYNYFTFYKAIILFTMAIISLLLLILRRWRESFQIKTSMIYFPIFFYILFVILSTAFSDIRPTAMFGFIERNEGAFTIIAYIIALVVSFNFLNDEIDIKLILHSLISSALVIGLIGLFQYFGKDLYFTVLGKFLIFPSELHHIADSIQSTLPSYTIASSLYNPNYVGSYMAMVFPISIGLYLNGSKLKDTTIIGFLSCIFFAVWIGCRSRAGILGGLLALVIIVFLTINKIMKKRQKLLIIIPYILIFIFMNHVSGGTLFSKAITINPIIEQNFYHDNKIDLEEIIISDNTASILGKDRVLNILVNDSEISYLNGENEILEIYSDSGNVIYFKDNDYSDFTFYVHKGENATTLFGKIEDVPLNWFIENNTIMMIGENGHLYHTIYHPEKWGFEGRERFGSSRGYIWSRTLPMIKSTIILGNGPDTYFAYFPQYDLVGKLKNFGQTNIIVDKPHNYYLQMAVDTGVLSLISILTLFGVYFTSSFRLFFKNDSDEFYVQAGIIIFAAICGYFTVAFFNDSVVTVAPVFWVLLGTGFSINHSLKLKQKNWIPKD